MYWHCQGRVPLDHSNAEMMTTCKIAGDIEIVNIEKIKFWEKEPGTAKDGRNAKIEFQATVLPKRMIVFYVRKKI